MKGLSFRRVKILGVVFGIAALAGCSSSSSRPSSLGVKELDPQRGSRFNGQITEFEDAFEQSKGEKPVSRAENKKILRGIDSDLSGLRDDWEREIKKISSESTQFRSEVKVLLDSMAKIVQVGFEAGLNDDEIPKEIYEAFFFAPECLWQLNPDQAKDIWRDFENVVSFNSVSTFFYLSFIFHGSWLWMREDDYRMDPCQSWKGSMKAFEPLVEVDADFFLKNAEIESGDLDEAVPPSDLTEFVAPEKSSQCGLRQTTLFFANGMFTSPIDAKMAFREIRKRFYRTLTNDDFEVSWSIKPDRVARVLYNQDENLFWQVFQVLMQKTDEVSLAVLRGLGEVFLSEEEVNLLVSEQLQVLSNRREWGLDLGSHESQVVKELDYFGRNVVIVAHSQGNFFANALYDLLKPRYEDFDSRFAIVSIGSPASEIRGRSRNIKFTNDVVTSWIFDSVEGNFVAKENPTSSWSNHYLIEDYLNDEDAGAEVMESLRELIVGSRRGVEYYNGSWGVEILHDGKKHKVHDLFGNIDGIRFNHENADLGPLISLEMAVTYGLIPDFQDPAYCMAFKIRQFASLDHKIDNEEDWLKGREMGFPQVQFEWEPHASCEASGLESAKKILRDCLKAAKYIVSRKNFLSNPSWALGGPELICSLRGAPERIISCRDKDMRKRYDSFEAMIPVYERALEILSSTTGVALPSLDENIGFSYIQRQILYEELEKQGEEKEFFLPIFGWWLDALNEWMPQ